jgi:hypothetical protein
VLLEVDAMVGIVGGVPGRTVVVAAVVIAVVVTISVAVGCCSWRIVAKLMRCLTGDGDLRYQVWAVRSLFGGVGGLLIFS